MRKFYLEDQNGKRISLNGDTGYFLNGPTGLGFTADSSYADIGRGFYIDTSYGSEPQGSIAGEILFLKDHGYLQYKTFMNWIAQSTDLYFVYMPVFEEFKRKIKFSTVTKSEISKYGILSIPIELTCLTPWYKETPIVITFPPVSDNAFRINSSYFGDDLNTDRFSETELRLEKSISGHIDAAFRLEIMGSCTNPVITVTGANTGKQYGKCALTVSIANSDTLIIDTREDNLGIWKKTRQGMTSDIISAITSLDANPFPSLPTTEPFIVQINSSDLNSVGSCQIYIYEYYRTV